MAWFILASGSLFFCLQSAAQRPARANRQYSPNNAAGREIFASRCAGCHGLDGLGGERAPKIVQRREVQRLPDSELGRIIQDGIPGTGMPPFGSLKPLEIKSVVTYLRTLQGSKRSVRLPGDPKTGKAIFFGNAGCSSCHMIRGIGGFIAPDLSAYAHEHAAEQIKAAITNPQERESANSIVTAITSDGQRYRGIVRNEDNFSLQLQSMDGTFHLLSKADLKSVERQPGSVMPSDYGSKLTPQQLNDLVSYLLSVARTPAPAAVHRNDDE